MRRHLSILFTLINVRRHFNDVRVQFLFKSTRQKASLATNWTREFDNTF